MRKFDLKPRILDLYIMKKFIMTFFIALLLIIGIVIIFDISEKIDDFVSNEAPLSEIIFDYYVNFIPYFMNMFSPLFVFITVIFFTSKMASNSEIVAILSCGISFHRMMVPYIVSAALIALFSLSLNLFIIPNANAQRGEFEAKYIRGHGNVITGRNVHYQISPGEFVFVESFSTWNNTAYKHTVETLSYKRLNELIATQKMRGDANVKLAQIEKHTRFAMPFSAFILTIMGVALSSKKRRGGIGWNIAIGIALAFTYILFLRFSQMFVHTGAMPPGLAMWFPNIVYAFIAGFLYKIAPK